MIAFHENYLEKRRHEPDFGEKDADLLWEELSQEYKDSNRRATDHIGVKVRSLGYKIVDIDEPQPPLEMSKEEILLLARLEHKRWNAERSLAGWTYNKDRNNENRETPDLTVWRNLSDET